MVSTREIQTLANWRLMVGLVSFVLTSLIVGVFSVLLYHYGSWKSFGDWMGVSLIPIAVLLVVVGLLLLVGVLVALFLRGVEFLLGSLYLFLVYFGGVFYLPLAVALLGLSACAGGAFIYAATHIMRIASRAGRAPSQ